MKKRLLIVTLVGALLTSILAPSFGGSAHAAAPASHAQAHTMFLDKTRFLLHTGVAYFSFHHFIYNPYKAGAFKSGASGRIKSIVKAGIAALFAVHELKVAYGIAKGSNSATLHALITPITKLMMAMQAAGNKFKGSPSSYSDATVQGLNTNATSLSTAASKGGYAIKDVTAPIPGT